MMIMKARLLNPGADTGKLMPPVSIDSREVEEGDAFFALVGEKFDGHNFILEALDKKPGLIVLSDRSTLDREQSRLLASDIYWKDNFYDGNLKIPFLQVRDTTEALQDLAGGIRELWNGPLIGITGSMGKTTTRAYAAQLLEGVKTVHSTLGNFNNHVGLPLSLLKLEDRHQLSILELGMNHAGEIAKLASICRPDTALLTNVAPVHLEFFSNLESIGEAKAEILTGLRPGGRLVYNLDDNLVAAIADRFKGPKTSFGFSEGSDVRISDLASREIDQISFRLTVKPWGEVLSVKLRSTGSPGSLNFAAAVAALLDYGLTPEMVVEKAFKLNPPEKRGRILKIRGITLWDDSYNSNPAALNALLSSIRGLNDFNRIILVLGDMLELGVDSPALHESCGRSVAQSGADALFTVGEESLMIGKGASAGGMPSDSIFSFGSSAEAAKPLDEFVQEGDLVIVKGSRGMLMETIVEYLKERT